MSYIADPYQHVRSRLNIVDALAKVQPNDLLPVRPEDSVRGELGRRFSDYLVRSIENGSYDPTPAYSVTVPKSRLTTRPAALLPLNDRVVYEAIVRALMSRVEGYLLGDGIVFWPRGADRDKRWNEFERSVISPDYNYVARSDIAGFYESIDHDELGDAIVRATGYRDLADALSAFLERIMGSRRGLPQGLSPSDTLATLYLAELDFVMVRNGYHYVRHGDDVRIGVADYDQGCRALRLMEATLRRLGLLLNVEKTRVLRSGTYANSIASHETTLDYTRKKIVNAKIENLRENECALGTAIREAGMEQLEWDLFYHATVDLEDAIEEIRPTLQPDEIEIAKELFLDAVQRQPGTKNALSREVFHQQLVWSLIRLSAGRSDAGVGAIAGLLKSFPEETTVVCSYLNALASEPSAARAVACQLEIALGAHNTEWETARMVAVLKRVPHVASRAVLTKLKAALDSPHDQWLASVEVAKLMANRGELERDTLLRMWDTCPDPLRADLVEAAARMAESEPWAEAFVASTKADPVHGVVIRHTLRNR